MLAILTFVPQEASALLRPLSGRQRVPHPSVRIHRGQFAGVPAAVCLVGTGAIRARRGLGAVQAALSPTAVAVCGVAAALAPDLQRGEVVVASQVLDSAGAAFTPTSTGTDLPAGSPPARHGSILTVDQVLVSAEHKSAAARSAIAADMETAAISSMAEAAGLPWCALRAISDIADETLPIDFNRCLDNLGSVHIPRVVAATLARPTAIPALARLGRNTSLACAALADFAVQYLPAWYPSVVTGTDPQPASR